MRRPARILSLPGPLPGRAGRPSRPAGNGSADWLAAPQLVACCAAPSRVRDGRTPFRVGQKCFLAISTLLRGRAGQDWMASQMMYVREWPAALAQFCYRWSLWVFATSHAKP
jgi:hypothetical protein